MIRKMIPWLIALMLCCGIGRAEGAIGSLARGEAKPANADVLSEMNGKRVAVQTGTISGEVAKRVLPDVELNYYNTQTDAMAALRAGKADAWATDEPAARYLLSENDDLRVADCLDASELAAVFPRNEAGRRSAGSTARLWTNCGPTAGWMKSRTTGLARMKASGSCWIMKRCRISTAR